MTARRSIVGLTVLCALVFSAFAAANASAKGTTAFTCVKGAATEGFSDADCSIPSATGPYHHVAFTGKTELKATGGAQVLKGKLAGVEIELKSTGLETTAGTIENEELGGTTGMKVTNTETVKYTGVTVTKPAGKSCVVKGGAVTTSPLKSESIVGSTATTTGIKFVPVSGTVFVPIEIEKCTVAALNGTFNVEGFAVGTPSGANLNFTAASTAGLKFGGNTASLEGTATVTGRANSTQAYTPLSITTTEP